VVQFVDLELIFDFFFLTGMALAYSQIIINCERFNVIRKYTYCKIDLVFRLSCKR